MLFLLFIISFFPMMLCDTYAVLWAGIYTFNRLGYASEASMYQTYHQLLEYGVKADNIITLGMDNAAYHEKNPDKGNVHAYPGGPNVYEGFQFDYIFRDNTPEVLKKVMTGEETGCGSRRILNSTEEDTVFVSSFQHGEPSCLIYFYDEEMQDYKLLLDKDLEEIVRTMKRKGMFKNLVFFTTACHSGSMFYKMDKSIEGWYAFTSAPPSKEALACDCEGEYPNDIYLNSCAAKAWQNYSRMSFKKGKLWEDTIYDEYKFSYDNRISTKYPYEEYCEYGDLSIREKTIGEIQGQKSRRSFNNRESDIKKVRYEMREKNSISMSEIIRRDKSNKNLQKLVNMFSDYLHDEENYDPEICNQGPRSDFTFSEYLMEINSPVPSDKHCIFRIISDLKTYCGDLSLHDISYLIKLEVMCSIGYEEEVKSTLYNLCKI